MGHGAKEAATMHIVTVIYCMKCHFWGFSFIIMKFYENWSGKSRKVSKFCGRKYVGTSIIMENIPMGNINLSAISI